MWKNISKFEWNLKKCEQTITNMNKGGKMWINVIKGEKTGPNVNKYEKIY